MIAGTDTTDDLPLLEFDTTAQVALGAHHAG